MKLDKDVQNFIKRLQSSAPVNIVGIGKVLGLNIWESKTLAEDIAGKIKRDPQHGGSSSYSVIVRAQDPVVRKRFTVAHEIAHYLLHRNLFNNELVDDGLYRSPLSTPIESQANSLAAELLMPAHLLAPLVDAKTPEELASLFQVSEQAMTIRLASLPGAAQTKAG